MPRSATACSSLGGRTRPCVGTEPGATRAVAHNSPLPAAYDGRTLRPTAPRGSEGQCPRLCREATERGWASNAHEAGVPSGGSLGRNLRSKTRWFTGFCNSHHVSHFATFFIDARAEISVAESRISFSLASAAGAAVGRLAGASAFSCSLASTRAVFRPATDAPRGARGKEAGGAGEAASASPAAFCHACNGRVFREATAMILPQVHLRKPCYDFSFL